MDKYGLIGHPLGHSFSKRFFNEEFFPQHGIDATYVNYEIPDAGTLLDIVRDNPNLKGLNCTIPYKQDIIPLLDTLSPQAKRIGAVNVIKIQHNDNPLRPFTLTGYNSDIIGFSQSLRPLLKPHHTKALILGTGGASKAICEAFKDLGIACTYVSRKARQGVVDYASITSAAIQEYTIIVNCTPVGMFPHTDQAPELPYHALTERHLLYDLIYNPEETLFMRLGRERGATVKNGMEMLRLQALASWDFWNS